MSSSPWDLLMEKAASCRREIFLVAPFVKQAVIDGILEVKQPHVSIHLVTRWRVNEVVAGVSDVTVFEALSNDPLATLSLHDTVHAKYYRFDDSVLIGSANLTMTGLGQFGRAVEILVPWPGQPFRKFEVDLLAATRTPDRAEFDELQDLVGSCRTTNVVDQGIDHDAIWYPEFRNPSELWQASMDSLYIASLREVALRDLARLGVPVGLTKEAFDRAIRIAMGQQRIIKELYTFTERPRRFGELRRWIRAYVPDASATAVTQSLMRWVREFLGNDFTFAARPYSEVLRRVGS